MPESPSVYLCSRCIREIGVHPVMGDRPSKLCDRCATFLPVGIYPNGTGGYRKKEVKPEPEPVAPDYADAEERKGNRPRRILSRRRRE